MSLRRLWNSRFYQLIFFLGAVANRSIYRLFFVFDPFGSLNCHAMINADKLNLQTAVPGLLRGLITRHLAAQIA